MTALRTVASGLLLMASSCVVVTPTDGARRSPSDPVDFAGYTIVRSQRIELQFLNKDGSFETFATTNASRDALILDDGTRLYSWDHAAVVPHWWGSGCGQRAQVRALGIGPRANAALLTYDEAGATCMNEAIARGGSFGRALTTCSRTARSVIDLSAGLSVVGDVEITTQSEADALVCVTRIEGNLTVRPSEQVVSLPNLQEVTGNLVIEVEDGARESDIVQAERADLPALTSVGGDVHFSHVEGGEYVRVNLGLPALTAVHGDLVLGLSSFDGYNRGLSAVQTVAGDVSIVARGDFIAPLLLVSLTSVAGDLSVSTLGTAGSSGNLLNSLQSVGGSVSLNALRNFADPVLNSLQSVGGDFTIQGSYWLGTRLVALTSVAGTLHVGGYAVSRSLPPGIGMGGATLTVGALSLVDSHFAELPFNAATSIAASGAITIEDNGLLCQATVDEFVADQVAAGWVGALSMSNNTGSCGP